uniref:LIM domain only protein 7-like n=1 Tax=Oncorhynchus gorbuscha TaxID=8017 RepID=UPI001EAEA9B8
MELSPSAVSQDQLQMVRARVHESEAKWHNDLTKWKLRRHRSNCDLRRKMQERDNIVLMANAGVGTVGTFKSLQEDREEDEESLCSNGHKVSPPTSFKEGSLVFRPHTRAPTSVSEGSLVLRPHTRAPLALSSSVESPYSPVASEPFTAPSVTLQGPGAVPQSEPLVLGGRSHTPVEPDGAGGLVTFPNSASPISSQTISSPALFISTGRDHNVSLLSNGIPTTLPGSSSSLTIGTSSSLTTSDPVSGTGSNLTSGTVSNLTSGTGSNLASGTGSNLASGTGSNLASGTGSNLASGTGSNLASGTGSNLASGTGSNLASGTGSNLASGTGSNLASGTGSNLASGTGSNLASGTGSNLASGTGSNLASGTGSNLASGTGSNLASGTGSNLTSGTGSNLTSGSGSNLASGTDSNLTSGSGSNLTSGTGSNLTSGIGSCASMDIPEHALISTVESLTSVGASGHVSAPQQQELSLYRYSSRGLGGRGRGASASLPRGYRRSEGSSSCLSAGFTPRPFGAKSSRVSSLPRLYNLEKTAPTRPQKMVTISEVAVRAQPWATANRSSVNQEVEEGGSQTQPSILKTSVVPGPATHPKPSQKGPLPPSLLPSLPVSVRQNGSAQVRHSDRVSLTLKINSRPHFGFNTHWDSTGARVGGIQPGSPAELCQLRAGDEIVSVGGHRVAEMSHSQWKGMMTSALQKGSLTMDVQRYGNNGPTDTSGDATMVKLANGQEVLTSKSRKGGFQDDLLTVRSKEHDLIVLKTQKRRAEFFNQEGGSASAISDLQVPSLSTSPSSWSWDPEEERRRQEKWQEEQERLLQEKYRQDQERLDAEWQQAQEEAGVEGYRQAEVTPDPLPSRCIVGYVVPCVKSSTPNMESSGEMTNGIAGLASPQPALSQPMPSVAHVASNEKEVVFDGRRREEPRPQEGRNLEEETEVAEGDNWSGDSYGFTQLSIADRMKSKSSPSLEGFHRQEVKGATREVARRKPPQSMSLVEAERQQILDEMRKRTALLTDNSWIRQRSTSDNKQPTNRRWPLRRYDSLDNLPSSTTLLSNPQRPHSSLGFSAPYRPLLPAQHGCGPGGSLQRDRSTALPGPAPSAHLPPARHRRGTRHRRITTRLTAAPS